MNRSSEVANIRREAPRFVAGGVSRRIYVGNLAVRNNAARSRIRRAFRTAAFRKLGQLRQRWRRRRQRSSELGHTPDWITLKGPNRWHNDGLIGSLLIALLLAGTRFVALYGDVTRFNRWKSSPGNAAFFSWKSSSRFSKSFAARRRSFRSFTSVTMSKLTASVFSRRNVELQRYHKGDET